MGDEKTLRHRQNGKKAHLERLGMVYGNMLALPPVETE